MSWQKEGGKVVFVQVGAALWGAWRYLINAVEPSS